MAKRKSPTTALKLANEVLKAQLADMTTMRDRWQKMAGEALDAGEKAKQAHQFTADKLRMAEQNIVKLETQLKTIGNIATNWEPSY